LLPSFAEISRERQEDASLLDTLNSRKAHQSFVRHATRAIRGAPISQKGTVGRVHEVPHLRCSILCYRWLQHAERHTNDALRSLALPEFGATKQMTLITRGLGITTRVAGFVAYTLLRY
jgi:hypothetical protein